MDSSKTQQMSEFTAKGLSVAMEQKGYDQLYSFYSKDFDFFDRLEAGLERVQQAFEGRNEESRFNMSFYPYWEEQGKPFVSAYIDCCYKCRKV